MTASNFSGVNNPFDNSLPVEMRIFEGVSYFTKHGAHIYRYDILDPRRVLTYQRMNSAGNWSKPLQGGIDDFGNFYGY